MVQGYPFYSTAEYQIANFDTEHNRVHLVSYGHPLFEGFGHISEIYHDSIPSLLLFLSTSAAPIPA